jgi:hypothetical protein
MQTYNGLKERLEQLKATGLKLHYKILDIRDVDVCRFALDVWHVSYGLETVNNIPF